MSAQENFGLDGLTRRGTLRAAALAAGVGFGAAACGSNTGRSSGGSGSGPALSQWYHQYGETGTEQAAKKYAASYTKANVSIQWIPGDYASKLSTGLVSSSGPDVFEYHPNVAMVQGNQIVALDDVIADVKDDFLPQDITANSYNGKVYGIRMIDDPQMLYYRKSLLSAAGVSAPTTFDELIEAAQKLTTSKIKGLYLGLKGGTDVLASPIVWGTGQTLLTDDHQIAFNSPDTVTALEKFRTLYQTKSLLLGAPTDWWDPSAFNQGLCAMQWNGLWAMPAVKKALGDDFGVIPLPKVTDGGKPVVYNGGWSAYVSAKSKNIDAAKAFVKWLWIDNTADQEDWSLSYGFHIPPRKSLASKASKLQSGQAADAVNYFNQYGVFDDPYFTPAMSTALQDMVNNVVVSGKDAKSELSAAVGAVQAELKKMS
jgi:multiple sugar transport system substrate-binding protein